MGSTRITTKMARATLLAALSFAGVRGAPQQSPAPPSTAPQSEFRHRIVVRSDLVVVPVTVKDPQGNLVGDLTPEEFRLFEDGYEQNVSLFSTEAFPLSAVIVLDNDLSQKAAGQVQRSLESIAAAFSASDEVALITYDEFPQTVLEFTNDNDALFTKLSRLRLGSYSPGVNTGPTTNGPIINGQSQEPGMHLPSGTRTQKTTKDLDNAVYTAAKMLRDRGRDRRKIICLVSDGTTTHQSQVTFDQARQILLSSDIAVYTIFAGNAFLQRESSRLEKFASETGGDAFHSSKQRDLERFYSRLTEEARHQYTLAYVPQKHAGGGYHSIEVRIERPSLRVYSRQGYFDRVVR